MLKLKKKVYEVEHNNRVFQIGQIDSSLALTEDSIKLVDFVKINTKDKVIVDVGTGIGTIAIFLTTKVNTKNKIIGFEIQKEIADIARENVTFNSLDNIKIINDDIRNYDNYLANNSVDIVVSNPPYFKIENHRKIGKLTSKAISRHEISLNFEDLVKITSKILKQNGRFYFIHRTERLIEIIEILKKYKLEPKTLNFIFSGKKQKSELFLMEAVYLGKAGLEVLEFTKKGGTDE